MKDEIIDELRKISDLEKKQLQSFVIFNMSKTEKDDILKLINNELTLINKNLLSQRNREMTEMLKELDWITDKYSDLYQKYKETSVATDIIGWEDDAYSIRYEQIASRKTKLKILIDEFYFEEIDIDEIKKSNETFSQMNETLDFSNLLRYNNDKVFARQYILTEEEKVYMALRNCLLKKEYAKYILCYNHGYSSDLNNLFKNRFKWSWLKWSIFIFEETQENFESKASEFVKTELYLNRKLL